jgi:DNA-binding LacI/PurR family transcriptional regulator
MRRTARILRLCLCSSNSPTRTIPATMVSTDEHDPPHEHSAGNRRREGKRPVTAHEVARAAGVSQSAVSRTFTEGASVSDSTRSKVMAAATALGYRPNLIASSLNTGRSRIVGVTVPSLTNAFYAALVDALSDGFAQLGYRVMLFTARHGTSSDVILEEILRYRVDALVLVSAGLSSRLADECHATGLPVVMVNRKTDSAAVSSVTGNNQSGAQQIAAFLAAGNHRRFAYLAGLDSSSTSRDRECGFRAGLHAAGLPAPIKAVGNYSPQGASTAARMLLGQADRPDAIFCANDQMALAAIDVARSEFNLRVGEDVSIVGFDNTELANSPAFALTTFSQPVDAMVERTVSIISEHLLGQHLPASAHIVDGMLIVRESARLPASGISVVDGRRVWHPPA